MKKLLVWDGDECLWNGTLIENKDVSLPAGRYELCQELHNRGVLQSIASHNIMSDVLETVHRLGLDNFILVPQASFNVPKSEMIAAIKEHLGLARLSDIVFVDDNELNLREVAYSLPDVITGCPSDVDSFKDLHFSKSYYTEDDRTRVQKYRSEQVRKESGKSYGSDKIGFLRSCELKAYVRFAQESDLFRIADLVRRANKLSAADKYYDESDLRHNLNNLVVLRASDKYGDYGLSGVMLVDQAVIKLLVISCRLQGKGLGSAFLGSIINAYNGNISAVWQATEYNYGVVSLYEWYKFNISKSDSGLQLAIAKNTKVNLPEWVEVNCEI